MFVFNVLRFFMFLAGMPLSGPCWGYIAEWGNEDPNNPPPCFYEQ